jgi:hypothetical protein
LVQGKFAVPVLVASPLAVEPSLSTAVALPPLLPVPVVAEQIILPTTQVRGTPAQLPAVETLQVAPEFKLNVVPLQ